MLESSSDEVYRLDYQTYIHHRSLLTSIEAEQIKSFDKSVLALSSGALGLSLTFADRIAQSPNPEWMIFLFFSWGCFCTAILSTTLSFLTSATAAKHQRDLYDKYFHSNSDKEDPERRYAGLTTALNFVSLIMVVAGVILLSAFAISNLHGVASYEQKSPGVSAQSEGSHSSEDARNAATISSGQAQASQGGRTADGQGVHREQGAENGMSKEPPRPSTVRIAPPKPGGGIPPPSAPARPRPPSPSPEKPPKK